MVNLLNTKKLFSSEKLAKKVKKARKISCFLFIVVFLTQFLPVTFNGFASGPRDFDTNAILYGGAYSKEELLSKIKNGAGPDPAHGVFGNYQSPDYLIQFYHTLGVYEPDINRTVDGQVHKDGTVTVNGARVAEGVFSAGRTFLAGSTQDSRFPYPVFWRSPSVSFASSPLDAFVLLNPKGDFVYAILKSCGNPVFKNVSPKVFPHGLLTKEVSNVTKGDTAWHKENTANPGDTLAYRITFSNDGDVSAINVSIRDIIPTGVSYTANSTKLFNKNNPAGAGIGDAVSSSGVGIGNVIPGGDGVSFVTFKVGVSGSMPVGTSILTNTAFAKADNLNEGQDTAKTTVIVAPPKPTAPSFKLSKSAFNVTQNIDATTVKAHAGDEIRYTLKTENVGDGAGNFNIEDNISDILEYSNITNLGGGTLTSGNISYGNATINPEQTITKNFTVTVKPFSEWPKGGDLTLTNTYGNTINIHLGFSNLDFKKATFNDTQGKDATTVLANPGDTITYTLTISNNGNDTASGVEVKDDISDVLEYANPLDQVSITNGVISLGTVNIPASENVSKTFRVQVKNPLPGNSQNGKHFDFKMENTYGNTVIIEIKRPGAILGVQSLVAAGANSFILVFLMAFMFLSSVFLYARERFLLINTLRNI